MFQIFRDFCCFSEDFMEHVDRLIKVFLCQLDAPGVPTKKKGRCGCTARPYKSFGWLADLTYVRYFQVQESIWCSALYMHPVYSHHMFLMVKWILYRGCCGKHPKTFHLNKQFVFGVRLLVEPDLIGDTKYLFQHFNRWNCFIRS